MRLGEEIDLEKKMWVVPGTRMKNGDEWRVPLSPRAMEILEESRRLTDRKNPLLTLLAGCSLLFPSSSAKPINDATLGKLLRVKGVVDEKGRNVVPHGFRSTFNGFLSECTNASQKVIDNALTHRTLSKTQRSYDRSDLFDQRVPLMDTWDQYLYG